jgi:DNA-directed RNA polymerase subunit N (RpoN/RPB10)
MLEEKNLPNLTGTDRQEQKDKRATGDTMIIPIRCYSCGKPVGQLWEKYLEAVKKGDEKKKTMDELGLKRYCCRALFLGHVDLIDISAQFKKV